jgi:hypothetical protein
VLATARSTLRASRSGRLGDERAWSRKGCGRAAAGCGTPSESSGRTTRPYNRAPVTLPRCYLVYAVAPESTSARDANELVNTYIEGGSRGLPVFHDHFTGEPYGGVAVFEVRTDDEERRLADLGPLSGWKVGVHALTFSLTGVGFVAQTDLTIEGYGNTTIEALRKAEPKDRRFWWQRRQGSKAS